MPQFDHQPPTKNKAFDKKFLELEIKNQTLGEKKPTAPFFLADIPSSEKLKYHSMNELKSLPVKESTFLNDRRGRKDIDFSVTEYKFS